MRGIKIDINLLMLSGQKRSVSYDEILKAKAYLEKIFEAEVLFRTLPAIPLQIFCKMILNSKVITRSIIDPDNNS